MESQSSINLMLSDFDLKNQAVSPESTSFVIDNNTIRTINLGEVLNKFAL